MIVVRSIDELKREKNSVVTVGTFDGVHLAHQQIVREVVHRARMKEGRSVVVTFDPHPKEIVGDQTKPVALLTTLEERIELLQKQSVDLLLVIEFTFEFSRLKSHEFYDRYLVKGIGVNEVVVGYDHMFGRNREGTTEDLVRMGQEFGFSVIALQQYVVDGEVVSSTRVRQAIEFGDIGGAKKFLGYDYQLQGTVVQGDGRGRTIGYPTANIEPDSSKKLIPAKGVYLVGVHLGGMKYFGMMNIGMRPTVTEGMQQTIEVHLFNFDQDIYGRRPVISFLKRLRDEQKFASLQDLVSQLGADKATSLRYLSEYVHE